MSFLVVSLTALASTMFLSPLLMLMLFWANLQSQNVIVMGKVSYSLLKEKFTKCYADTPHSIISFLIFLDGELMDIAFSALVKCIYIVFGVGVPSLSTAQLCIC